jgi:hypothetical protein
MHKIKTISSSLAALLMAVAFTVSVPVYAEHGSNSGSGSGGSGDSSVATTTSTTTKADDDNGTGTETETEAEHTTSVKDDSRHTELHAKAQAMVAELKQEHAAAKTKSAEDRQKTCEAHKQGLNTKFSRLDTNAQRIQDRIDSIFQKAQDYQSANNVSGVDDLVAAAKTAQTNSAASITQMKAVTPSLDCNNTSVASDVATFKVAAKTTHDNLKAYRDAVRAVLKAEATAKHDSKTTDTSATDTTERSNQ